MPKCAARDAGGIGPGPEQRGMAERGDAAIAGHQIERQYQQGDGDDAGEQCEIVGEEEDSRPRRARGCAAMPIRSLRRLRLRFARGIVVRCRVRCAILSARREAAREHADDGDDRQVEEELAEFRHQIAAGRVDGAEQQAGERARRESSRRRRPRRRPGRSPCSAARNRARPAAVPHRRRRRTPQGPTATAKLTA